jgi:hypothetical protein
MPPAGGEGGVKMRDVWTTKTLAGWEAPLRRWFGVLDQYRDAAHTEPDVAYWYNERATLSTLAGALWLSGCMVLEEYRTVRGGDGSRAHGRADLWCKIGEAEYTVEAKQGPKLSYPAKHATLASWAELQLAAASAQCITDNYGGTNRLAMVFIVPRLREPSTDATLRKWIDAIRSFNADLKASYLDVNGPLSKTATARGRFFPGVVLLARLVPRSEPLDE